MTQEQKLRLNSAQQEAVKHVGSPLLIIAGAGTGKTTVITERIVHLIEETKVVPESILALTFTEKAANEMLERVDFRLPIGHSEPVIRTFHAFCDQILRQYGLEIGINIGYTILSEIESWMFFREHLFAFDFDYYRPVGNPTKFVGEILSYFGKLQDENVTPKEYQLYAKNLPSASDEEKNEKKRHSELSKAYEKYLDMKLTEDSLEFSDLHYYTLKLFMERPNVLERVRKQYAHVLVDEFQDTNLIQFRLLTMLSPDGENLAVVADDDQSIYAFRGSNISNILNLRDAYPNLRNVTLVENYRSPQDILDKTHELIQYNNPERLEVKEKVSKKLVSSHDKQKDAKASIEFSKFTRDYDEVNFVADTISKALEDGVKPSEIAVLVRANSYAHSFTEEFRIRSIPYQFIGLRGLYEREEIRDLLSFIRFLKNQKDDLSLFRLLKLPFFDVPMEEVLKLTNLARTKKVSLWFLVKKNESEECKKFSELFATYIEKCREYHGGSVLHEFVQRYYYPPLLDVRTLEEERKVRNIVAFFERIRQFESRSEQHDIVALADFLDLAIEAGENPATAESELDVDAVKVMTVHAAKGLEFPMVFVPCLVSQRFPSMNRSEVIPFPDGLKHELSSEAKSNIQEERRLFYVACTRAKSKLYLTASSYYGDIKRPKKISPFVWELGFQKIEDEKKKVSHDLSAITAVTTVQTHTPVGKRNIPPTFSVSQIQTFMECPRKYEYANILRIRGESTPALTFGNSLHNTLKRFYDFLVQLNVPKLFSEKPDLKETLFEIYASSFIRTDYLTKQHEKQAYDAGKKMLTEFFKKNGPDFTIPILIEKSFTVPLGDFLFKGRIDRIDRLQGNDVEVIDYKSGSTKSQREANKDIQLSLYAIACKEIFGLTPKKLSLYFLKENTKVETSRSEEEMEEAKMFFMKQAKLLTQSDFAPTPNQFTCKYCFFRTICNAAML